VCFRGGSIKRGVAQGHQVGLLYLNIKKHQQKK